MIETPQQTKSAEATPEQLLQLLDLQISSQRAKRKVVGGRKSRPVLLVSGLILILGAAFVALFILQQMAGDLRHSGETPSPQISLTDSQ